MIHGLDTSVLVAAELVSHPRHADCLALLQRIALSQDSMGLASQVLAELVHTVTDPRRSTTPLDILAALKRAESIWTASKVRHVFPDAASVSQFFLWMQQHRLGRKRLLDTLLAATYFSAGIHSIVTLNRGDFDIFGCFSIVEP